MVERIRKTPVIGEKQVATAYSDDDGETWSVKCEWKSGQQPKRESVFIIHLLKEAQADALSVLWAGGATKTQVRFGEGAAV